ncbi:MAG TPA: hypothetical protein VFN67_24720 [Polyangiales bacterium]|nr:hypothetical protein [Polyangiales bacterium]
MNARLSSAVCLVVTACSSAPSGEAPAAMSSNATMETVGETTPASNAGTTAKRSAAVSGSAGKASPSASAGSTGGTTPTNRGGAGASAGSSGSGGMPPTAASAGASGSAQAAAAGMSAAGAAQGAPALPPITDAGAKGPYEIEVQENLEGLSTHISIAPKELGKDGIKHPIVVWVNGAGTGSTGYRNMLDNVAAHGFFLLDDKQSSFESAPEVEAQKAAIDWAIAQAEKQGSPYFGKLDTSRIAIAGHSMGGVSTFGNVEDTRIKTSIHMAGGVTGNPEGVDESWLQNLHAPATFLCGDRDTNGLPRCMKDFQGAPAAVPLFFGILAGVGHTDEFTQPNGGRWGRILISWLRWQLADDASFAKAFQGPSCEFCMGDWTAMKHAID